MGLCGVPQRGAVLVPAMHGLGDVRLPFGRARGCSGMHGEVLHSSSWEARFRVLAIPLGILCELI